MPVLTRKLSGVLSNFKVKTVSVSIVLPTRGLTETSVADFCTVYCNVCFPSRHVTSTRNTPEPKAPMIVAVFPFVFAVPVLTFTFSGMPSKRNTNAVSAEIVLPARGETETNATGFRTVYCNACFPSSQVTSNLSAPGTKGPVIVEVFPEVLIVPLLTRTFCGVSSNFNTMAVSGAIVLPVLGVTEAIPAGFKTVYANVSSPPSHVIFKRIAPGVKGPLTVTVLPAILVLPVLTRTFLGVSSKRMLIGVFASIVLSALGLAEMNVTTLWTVYTSACVPSFHVTSKRSSPGAKGPETVTVLPMISAVPVLRRRFWGVPSNCKVRRVSISIVDAAFGLTEMKLTGLRTVYRKT